MDDYGLDRSADTTSPGKSRGRYPTGRGDVATRLWAELRRDALTDLTFVASPHQPMWVWVERKARLSQPAWAYVPGTWAGQAACRVVAFLVTLALCRRGRLPQPSTGSADLSHDSTLPILGLLGSAAGLAVPQGTSGFQATDSYYWRVFDPLRHLGTLALPVLYVAMGALGLRRPPHERTDALPSRRSPWPTIATATALTAGSHAFRNALLERGPSVPSLLWAALASGGLLLFVWTTVLAPVASRPASRRRGAMTAIRAAPLSFAIVAPVLVVTCRASVAMLPDKHDAAAEEYKATLALTTALRLFREANGAYPARLVDLTASTPPARGVDTSGNPVPIPASTGYMRQIPQLPTDVLTGRTDTWVYDPRCPFLVESGGYRVTVSMQPVRGRDAHPSRGTLAHATEGVSGRTTERMGSGDARVASLSETGAEGDGGCCGAGTGG